ncbi:hypothetical protein GCM10009121_30230 [Rhodanobacter soli]
MVSVGAKLVLLARILLLASTVEPSSTEPNVTAAGALFMAIGAVEDGAGAGAVAAGGIADGAGAADSSFLPQALKASTAASDAARIKGWRVIFMGYLLLQDWAGIFNVWPGWIRSGSVSWSRFASKIRFHAFALP